MDIAVLRAVLAWHAGLSREPRVLAASTRQAFGSPPPMDGLADLLDRISAFGHARSITPEWDLADRALTWSGGQRRALVTCCDPRYPATLLQIPTPPLVLFVHGDVDLLGHFQFAIVGSRKATRAACDFAAEIASQLVRYGTVITSGLAQGVDAAAHRGALAGNGHTLAVFGCGIDRVYPTCHRKLAAEIVECGVLVSEFPLGAAPRKHHFPQRNRLIAGLSSGTLVVEAAARSGSISTAMHALEQGREVFAVPGSIHNPLSSGCHALIRQGAKLTEGLDDILSELPPLALRASAGTPRVSNVTAQPGVRTDHAGDNLLQICGWEPFTIDELVSFSGLTVQEVSSMLLPLELAGLIEARSNGTYVRVG